MKRRDLERHLRRHGCRFLESGGKHDTWLNERTLKQSSIPRHREVKYPTAAAICKQLEVPPPPGR